MNFGGARRPAVGNLAFASTVIILLIVAAGGFVLYATRPTITETMQEPALAFVPATGQMIHGGWLIATPLGNGSYAVTVYAQGLKPPSAGGYIVEAAQKTGQKAMVPIAGSNVTLSEFDADNHGNGLFFTILHQNPNSLYGSVSIIFLPGMQMQNAVVAATAALP